ncbi:MAG: hypothetical protein V1886_01740 [archaeon]
MKNKFFFVLLLLAALFQISSVSAVGIGDYGGQLNYIIDFKPGLKESFSYFLVANTPSTMDYEITVDGTLSQYFKLSNELFKDVQPGMTKTFSAVLQLPEQKPEPGLHDNFLCVTELQSGAGGGVTIRTKACSIVSIRVLSPDIYAKIDDFQVPNIDSGDIITLTVAVRSWTEKDISNVSAVIDLFGPTDSGFNRKITTLKTSEKSLPSNDRITLSAELNTKDFESGEYYAVATVYYDGNEINTSSRFRVGLLAVKVVNYTKELVRNKINKFNVDVQSRWNSAIENVYASIIIDDGKNEVMKSPAIALKPWETATLTAYYDAAEKKAQYYNGEIRLYFSGNSTSQEIKVKMLVNPEEIKRLVFYTSATAIFVGLIIIIVFILLKNSEMKNAKKRKKSE